MEDWCETETVVTFFRKNEEDEIVNLDEYIATSIKNYGPDYIFKLLKNWEEFVMRDDTEEELSTEYDTIYKYMSTYIRLYVIEDVWSGFYTEFLSLLKEVDTPHSVYLTSIISLFRNRDILDFNMKIYKRGMLYYKKGITSNNIDDNRSDLLFLIHEFISLDHEDVQSLIYDYNYDIKKPLISSYSYNNRDYNLINVAFLLPQWESDNYEKDIATLNKLTRYLLKKSFKPYMLSYLGNICDVYKYRLKDFYNMSIKRDVTVDNFLINFTNIMLKLWDGGRRLHHSRIGDIDTKYLYSSVCFVDSFIDEATLSSSSSFNNSEIPEKFDFLTECFYLTHRFVMITLYPIIKVYYKMKYKNSELKRSMDGYIQQYGLYDEIPILERSIYDRLKKMIDFYSGEIDKIIKITSGKYILDICYLLCEDTVTILDNLYENNRELYDIFPESILDFVIEYVIYHSSFYSFELPKLSNFIVNSMSVSDKITNPYLRYKCFDLISMKTDSINFVLSTTFCKRTLINNIILLYLDADKISTPHVMRDRINYFMIKSLKNSDYCYSLSTYMYNPPKKMDYTRQLVEYLYMEMGELLVNFDSIIKNIKSIYKIRNDESLGSLETTYEYKMNNSFVYVSNIISLMKLLINMNDIQILFLKRELIIKFISFIHYMFGKCDKYSEAIKYCNEKYKSENNIFERFDNLYEFGFKMYHTFSKYPIFLDIADKTAFFDKNIMLEKLETCFLNGQVNLVHHDELVVTIDEVHKKIQLALEDKEVPEEFLDPIMSTPIEEPILLPESDIIMDLNVISTHLLTNKTNPFTRSELTMEILKEYNKSEHACKLVNDFKTRYKQWRDSDTEVELEMT